MSRYLRDLRTYILTYKGQLIGLSPAARPKTKTFRTGIRVLIHNRRYLGEDFRRFMDKTMTKLEVIDKKLPK